MSGGWYYVDEGRKIRQLSKEVTHALNASDFPECIDEEYLSRGNWMVLLANFLTELGIDPNDPNGPSTD